ncbi:RNA polymerase sigma-70 factor, ECF subfamily [Chitinophaga rupis]|uniref:RNA polymerase sigma-70 factor, ECF subfamily n=1 Tax=Chitinophaga rupis TaxID=573321 RepID=A0A1H7GN60_9BACT|nr:sigma-70 family RNA polymerase sigma factor [Chitinophaga rupis]SEK39558.1 RNA polymerase sigma-70 factor, ECF subfamily [Chitinophaga rupis]
MDTNSDKEKFMELMEQNKGIIFTICNSYCKNRNDIDDLSQDIVYNLWKSFNSYNTDLKFSTWMYRVALNVAISFYRKRKRLGSKVIYNERLIQFETDNSYEEAENLTLLFNFISTFKDMDKSIIFLYLENKTYKEIASIVGISETNVATRIGRIKERLKSDFQTAQNKDYGTK